MLSWLIRIEDVAPVDQAKGPSGPDFWAAPGNGVRKFQWVQNAAWRQELTGARRTDHVAPIL